MNTPADPKLIKYKKQVEDIITDMIADFQEKTGLQITGIIWHENKRAILNIPLPEEKDK